MVENRFHGKWLQRSGRRTTPRDEVE